MYATLYTAMVIWTSRRTNLTYGARYLLPIAPLIACLVVVGTMKRPPLPVGTA